MKEYRIVMLHCAKEDLSEMIDYLAKYYPSTALKQYDRIIEKIKNLEKHPFMYEEYKTSISDLVYRKLTVDNYLVFYTVNESTVEIHAIINGKTNFNI